VAEARPTAEARQIELECNAEQLTGNWDAAGLARVVSNLLSNAIKYSPNGSTITVAVARAAGASGEAAVLTVRDRGVGIPENELGRIFDPYHRGANVAGRTAGTGIGLVSARQIVEQHGGRITAESTLGQGSAFTVRLPLH
jgi:signal transduction histidine kinase